MNPRRAALWGGTLAVAAGCLGLRLAGAPLATPLINAAAALIGIGLVLATREPGQRALAIVLITAVAGVALATLAGIQLDGVRRWVRIGPVILQPALIAAPAVVVALARRPGWIAAAAVAGLAALLAIQPDRAAATALLAGTAIVVAARHGGPALFALVAALASAGVTWFRPDPLPPVRFVEGVVAAALGNGGAVAALVAVGTVAMLTPALATGRERATGMALAATFLALLAMSVAGAYPTPLLGFGVSSVLGWFAATALLPRRPRA